MKRTKLVRSTLLAFALFAASGSAYAQTEIVLAGDLAGCPVGSGTLTLAYSGVNVRIGAAGIRLNCNTVIVVSGGDIIVDGPVSGRKSHADPRPDGQAGYSSFNLTLQTMCGPRLLTDINPTTDVPPLPLTGPVGGNPKASMNEGASTASIQFDPTAFARPTYCGDILINNIVDLTGEYGTDGRQADSAGTGFAGGTGGNGGAFTALSVGHITQGSIIATSGGQGGSGGAGGPDTSCDAAGQGNGGWGASGGKAGSVTLTTDTNARADATISIGGYTDYYGVLRRSILANGGSSGNGGWATAGAQHGCGATAGAGGSAADGGRGGKVTITGRHVVASTDYYNTPAADTSGGSGGNAGPGASGGSIACNLLFGPAPFCPPPINGGPAGDAGKGGAAGAINIYGTNAATAPVNPTSIEGGISLVAAGGQGGAGASGGNGGSFVDYITPDCSKTLCCGSGGFTTAGDSGGAGGSVIIKSPLFRYSAVVVTRGGNGGWGTHGSSGGCGPCDGEQGGAGGAGGSGGAFSVSGNQATPFDTSVFMNLWGGCGGGGGDGVAGAFGGVGGTHGTKGVFSNFASPAVAASEDTNPCSGTKGPDGQYTPCTP